MGIRPPSDLVFDVMQAAEAGRAQQVMGKLQALKPADGAAFDTALAKADEARSYAASGPGEAALRTAAHIPAGLSFSGTNLTNLRNAHALSSRPAAGFAAATPGAAPLKKFEAMVLSNFLEHMMPASSGVYGGGSAGQTWKSLLTEKLGERIADAGGIGIAKHLGQANALFRNTAAKTGDAA